MASSSWDRVPIDAQSVEAPLSRSAIFLVVGVKEDKPSLSKAASVIGGIGDLIKTVGFRDLKARLSCVVGIGDALWRRIQPDSRPAELKPFTRIDGGKNVAPSTPGDVLFHIRAERQDFCFEFERILLDKLGDSITVIDEVFGFRNFDSRDLLGFVDGTANPVGAALTPSALVGDEDKAFAGGSYIVTQKYLHDLGRWQKTPTPEQEAIIGRTKLDNIELDDDNAPRKSHKTLATIVDEHGVEHDILRDNMPFGRPGHGEYGTYFIGYSRRLWVTEKMLQRMFVGEPAGSYDRILDFSTAHTGTTFFAPAHDTLSALMGKVSGD